jgi:iron-sulfur cluster assembly protein
MINVTDNAKLHIKDNLNKIDKPYLFFGLKGGGCAGFEYYWQPMSIEEYSRDGAPDKDEFIDVGDNKKFILDYTSQIYLIGSTIDYKTDFLNSQLVVVNPMAKSSCGCGSSISV